MLCIHKKYETELLQSVLILKFQNLQDILVLDHTALALFNIEIRSRI